MPFNYRGMRTKTAVAITLAAALIGVGAVFLVVAVGLGLASDTVRISDAASRRFADHQARAGDVAGALSCIAVLGAIVLALKADLRPLDRLHWGIRTPLVVLAAILAAFGTTMLMLRFSTVSYAFGSLVHAVAEVLLRLVP